MKNFKSHFKFNKQERSGIFFLLLMIVSLQVGYFILRSFPSEESINSFSKDSITQTKIDGLKEEVLRKDSVKIYPFNPNFITDYKGYSLGMSIEEIDRLHTFRATNKYANSPQEFQKITLVSDSLLKVISPYFKFPEWTKKSKQYSVGSKNTKAVQKNSALEVLSSAPKSSQNVIDVKDLNTATAEELKSVNGIGEKLSARIIKFRDKLGGFLVNEQLYDVYGLEREVADRVLMKFKVIHKPEIEKININSASAYEISGLVYINYGLAKEIVAYRMLNGSFATFNDLKDIPDFPAEKIDRIALYLKL